MTMDMHSFEQPFQEKVWEEVRHVFDSPDVGVSILKVMAGFRCSRHWHEKRANRFVVVTGKIAVHEWSSVEHLHANPRVAGYAAVLKPGQETNIPAYVPHMFEVIESGIVIEIYTPDGGEVSMDDIVRFDEGGLA